LALLALALTGSAFADDRAFSKALSDWEALYQPLASADPASSAPLLERIARESAVRERVMDDLEYDVDRELSKKRDEVERRNLVILDTAFERADPNGRRAMLRLYGRLGDYFGLSTVPSYAICGEEEDDFGDKNRILFLRRVRKQPALSLSLLKDSDHRVAELAALALTSSHPAVVRKHFLLWSRSPRPHFRGIALMASRMRCSTPDETREINLALLDDPSEPIREWAVRMLPPQDAWEAYRVRRLTFAKSSTSRKRTTLQLGMDLESPAVVPLAMTSLSGDESVAEMAFAVIRRMSTHLDASGVGNALHRSRVPKS
jgi:hypothetical protein